MFSTAKQRICKRVFAFGLAFLLVLPSALWTADAAQTADYGIVNGPRDLNFRKFYTGRSLFDSEIPLKTMDFTGTESAANGLTFMPNGEKLTAINETDETRSALVALDEMKTWSAYDLEVDGQRTNVADGEGASTAGIVWKKDDNNYVSVSRSVIDGTEETGPGETGPLYEGLTLEDALDIAHAETLDIYNDVGSFNIARSEGQLVMTNSGNTAESFVAVAPLRRGAVLEIDVAEQTTNAYYASAMLRLRYDVTAPSARGVNVIQRGATGSATQLGVYQNNGSAAGEATVVNDKVYAPYTLRVRVEGTVLKISRIVDGVEGVVHAFDTTRVAYGLDLNDDAVLSNLTFVVGGRLGRGETLRISGARQYVNPEYVKPEEPEETEVLYSLDMSDPDLLDTAPLYRDSSTNNPTAAMTENGLSFVGSARGESFVPIGPAGQRTVAEATVYTQTHVGYTANAIIKLRDKSYADNATKSNGVFLAQRDAQASSKTLTLEVFLAGASVSNSTVSSVAAETPYTLRMWIDGNVVHVERVVNGTVVASGQVDVGARWNLTDPAVLANFEYCIGARLDPNERVTYASASIKQMPEPEHEVYEDRGIVLNVVKNGSVAVNKVIAYRAGAVSAPYTLRIHWTGQYIHTWIVKDGKPTYLGTDDLGAQYDFRIPSVIDGFKAYAAVTLTPGAEVTVGRFRNYYTGGDGQADPRPLHYRDGTIMTEGNKIWLEMTTRGYQPIPASYQGIYSFDLETYELQLVSVVLFDKGDANGTLWGFHASDFVYDEVTDTWIVVTSSHGSDKKLRIGALDPGVDPRVDPLVIARISEVSHNTSVSGLEDPSLRFDPAIGKWRMISCYSGTGGFNTIILTSETDDPLGSYVRWGAYTSGSTTGNQLVSVGGTMYGFVGRGVSNLEAFSLPAYKDDPAGGQKVCSLAMDYVPDSNNIWPVILAFTDAETGTETYRMLTFDRDQVAYVSGYSYGRIYLYEADECWNPNGLPATPAAAPAAGAATSVIATAADLYAMRGDLGGRYTLAADIDLKGFDWFPIGTKAAPFTGSFNGNGHTISNLTADLTGLNGVGLFGYTSSSASISDLRLARVNVAGGVYTGGLVGYNGGAVTNVTVSGTVRAEAEGGLLAGRNTSVAGLVTNCETRGTVTGGPGASVGGLVGNNKDGGVISRSSAGVDVSGVFNVGGFAGYNDRATIRDSFATGRVVGTGLVGGFVGNNASAGASNANGVIERCYASGVVSGTYTVGGFAGFNDRVIRSSFAAGSVSASEQIAGGFAGKNNQYGSVTSVYGGAVTVGGARFVGSTLGKNVGDFTRLGYEKGSPPVIGNSPLSVVGTENPNFTNLTTYSAGGALADWNNGIWILAEGKLPALRAEPDGVVVFTDGAGDVLTGVTSGTLTATLNWGQIGETESGLVFILVVYAPDGRLLVTAVDEKTAASAGEGRFEVSVTVSETDEYAPEDCTAAAYLWDAYTLEPLIPKAVLGAAEAN
jgi:hypothetical protein